MSLTVFPFQASIYLQNRQYYIDWGEGQRKGTCRTQVRPIKSGSITRSWPSHARKINIPATESSLECQQNMLCPGSPAYHLEAREGQGWRLKMSALSHLDKDILAPSILLLIITPNLRETDTVLGRQQGRGGGCMKGSTFLSKRC